MEKIRKRFIFYGSVQGVGFRYRACHAANMFGVTGWVRNCSDGSVEMEAEGSPEAIDKLLLTIEQGHYITIENLKETVIAAEGDRSFGIK